MKCAFSLLAGFMAASAALVSLNYSADAQSRLSFSQLHGAIENRCTFQKREVTTWRDENNVQRQSSRTYPSFNFGCAERVFQGTLVDGALTYASARSNWFEKVVTLRGSGFTVFCRGVSPETVDWFRANASSGDRFRVVGNFQDVEEVFTRDLDMRNCQFSAP